MQFEQTPHSTWQNLTSVLNRGSTQLLWLIDAKAGAMSSIHEVVSPIVKNVTDKTKPIEAVAKRTLELLAKGHIVACDGAMRAANAVRDVVAKHPYIAIVICAGAVAGIFYMLGGMPVLIQLNNTLCAMVIQAWQTAIASTGEIMSSAASHLYELFTYVPVNVRVSVATLVNDVAASTITLCNSIGAVVCEYSMLLYTNASSCSVWISAQVSEMAAVFLSYLPPSVAAQITKLLAYAQRCAAPGQQFAKQAIQYAVQNPVKIGLLLGAGAVGAGVVLWGSPEWLRRGPIFRQFREDNGDDINERNQERREAYNDGIVPGADAPNAPGPEYMCPIALDFCYEPVAVRSANGIIRYYERREIVRWWRHCISIKEEPFAPHTRETIHFETESDFLVDEEAKRILDDFRAATGGV